MVELEYIPQVYLEQSELCERIVDISGLLPFEYRWCVLMRYFEKLDAAAMDEIQGWKPGVAERKLAKAIQQLKLLLAAERLKHLELWENGPMAAFGPALEAVFRRSAETQVSDEVIARCLAAAGIKPC